MKKLLAIMLVGIMVFSLTACGSEFEGEWKAVSAEMMGEKAPEEKLKGFSINIKSDGKAELTIEGETQECEWEEDGDTLILKDSETEVKAVKDGDQLVFEDFAGMGVKIVFEKK